MWVIDANLLLYAYDDQSPCHGEARIWLEQLLSGNDLVGIPWQSVGAFLRISTHPKLPGMRAGREKIMRIVSSWAVHPSVRMLAPGERHLLYLKEMVLAGQASGPMITDAQLAALTMEHGGYLCTADRDFGRFPGLRWGNPLISPER